MLRRLASLACLLAIALTLWVAALHKHAVCAGPGEASTAACAYCAGGLAAAPAPTVEPLARLLAALPLPAVPEAPARRTVLPLAHSGNAPPAA